MSLAHFKYGVGAVIHPAQLETFNELRDSLVASTRPGNFAEQLIVDQLLHAQWELHRVRTHANNTEAEASLHATFTRATRNWQRAMRQLTVLQSARASAELCDLKKGGSAPPLANLARVPRQKGATKSFMDWHADMLEFGYDGPAFFDRCYDDLCNKEAA